MKRGLYLSSWFLCVFIVMGCASLGVPQADTFNKQVVQANALVEVSANMVAVAHKAEKISTAEAREILRDLRGASEVIDAAVLLKPVDAGDAASRLSAAILRLQRIKALLQERST